MVVYQRCLLAVGLSVGALTSQASAAVVKIETAPGTVVRWSVPGTKRCGMGAKSWLALQETCYYPIDLGQKGMIRISRRGAGPLELAQIVVTAASTESENIDLGDSPQAHPTPEDLRRNQRDQALVAKVWTRRSTPARFTLPLGRPTDPLPEGKGFGSKWIFSTKPETWEIHSGVDYAIAAGTPVVALADGMVAVAADLFFTGNAVFIDHGDQLVSMYFHLSDVKVQAGQEVKKGEVIGLVGSTGRVTGPHLHMGLRWRDARINPQILLDDPAKIPSVVR